MPRTIQIEPLQKKLTQKLFFTKFIVFGHIFFQIMYFQTILIWFILMTLTFTSLSDSPQRLDTASLKNYGYIPT